MDASDVMGQLSLAVIGLIGGGGSFVWTRDQRRILGELFCPVKAYADYVPVLFMANGGLWALLGTVSRLCGWSLHKTGVPYYLSVFLFLVIGAVVYYRIAVWNSKSPRARRAEELQKARVAADRA